MFLFSVKCPVNDREKQWIEESMLWLADQFGSDTLCGAEVILPTPEYSPDPFRRSRDSVQKMMSRICEYMGIDPDRIQLEFYSEQDGILPANSPLLYGVPQTHSGTAGLYVPASSKSKRTRASEASKTRTGSRAIIAIEMSQLDNPSALMATLGHEAGHLVLDDKRVQRTREHYEHLTDLATVFLGMGVLTANAAFRVIKRYEGITASWKMSRQGYLSEPMYGYALASFAWMRGEEKTDWSEYLERNIWPYFRDSRKYLKKTQDTTLPIYARP